MTDQNLIQNLTKDLKPVNPWLSPEKRLLVWFFIHFSSIGAYLLIANPIPQINFNPKYIFELGLFFATSLSCGYLAFLSVIPGTKRKSVFRLSLITFFLLASSMLIGVFSEDHNHIHVHNGYVSNCFLEVIVLGMIPMVTFAILMRNGIMINKLRGYFFAGLASSVIPAGHMHIICSPIAHHALIWHFGVAVVVGLIGGAVLVTTHKEK